MSQARPRLQPQAPNTPVKPFTERKPWDFCPPSPAHVRGPPLSPLLCHEAACEAHGAQEAAPRGLIMCHDLHLGCDIIKSPQGQALWPGPKEQRAPRGCFYSASRVLWSSLLQALHRSSLLSPNQHLPPNFRGRLLAVPAEGSPSGGSAVDWKQWAFVFSLWKWTYSTFHWHLLHTHSLTDRLPPPEKRHVQMNTFTDLNNLGTNCTLQRMASMSRQRAWSPAHPSPQLFKLLQHSG